VTLLISLVMLTILTLFAAAMIRLSSTNMLIAGNMAVQHSLRDVVQRAIEADLSSTSFYSDAVGGHGCWTGGAHSAVYGATTPNPCFAGANTNGYTVTMTKPICLTQQVAPGNGALVTDAVNGLMETFWEVSATGYDSATGTSVTLTQGARVIVSGNTNCTNS
jgi:hypothetical protein